MPNTYTQLHIHFVFAVKYRAALIKPSWENRLHLYITSIVQNMGNKMLAIENAEDHIHMFIGIKATQTVAQVMEFVKSSSTDFINDKKLCPFKFLWQGGYAAFSVSHSQIDKVVKYILNQKEHHKKETFLSEYRKLLTAHGIDYNNQYVFLDPI